MRIVPGTSSILLVVNHFKLLEALHLGVVNVLGKGDERRGRSRSKGSRHFDVEDRLVV